MRPDQNLVQNCVDHQVWGTNRPHTGSGSPDSGTEAAKQPKVPYVVQQCFRAGNRASGPDFGWTRSRESIKLGPPAGRRPAEGQIYMFSLMENGRNPARKPHFRPGNTIA